VLLSSCWALVGVELFSGRDCRKQIQICGSPPALRVLGQKATKKQKFSFRFNHQKEKINSRITILSNFCRSLTQLRSGQRLFLILSSRLGRWCRVVDVDDTDDENKEHFFENSPTGSLVAAPPMTSARLTLLAEMLAARAFTNYSTYA
jgi:hypothetical protein